MDLGHRNILLTIGIKPYGYKIWGNAGIIFDLVVLHTLCIHTKKGSFSLDLFSIGQIDFPLSLYKLTFGPHYGSANTTRTTFHFNKLTLHFYIMSFSQIRITLHLSRIIFVLNRIPLCLNTLPLHLNRTPLCLNTLPLHLNRTPLRLNRINCLLRRIPFQIHWPPFHLRRFPCLLRLMLSICTEHLFTCTECLFS